MVFGADGESVFGVSSGYGELLLWVGVVESFKIKFVVVMNCYDWDGTAKFKRICIPVLWFVFGREMDCRYLGR
jgi:hypothetical protein